MTGDTRVNVWYLSVLLDVSWCCSRNSSWKLEYNKDNMTGCSYNSSTCAYTCTRVSRRLKCIRLSCVSPTQSSLYFSNTETLKPCRTSRLSSKKTSLELACSTHRCKWQSGWWSHPLRNEWWGSGAPRKIQALRDQSGYVSWALLCWLFGPQGSPAPTSAANPSAWEEEAQEFKTLRHFYLAIYIVNNYIIGL